MQVSRHVLKYFDGQVGKLCKSCFQLVFERQETQNKVVLPAGTRQGGWEVDRVTSGQTKITPVRDRHGFWRTKIPTVLSLLPARTSKAQSQGYRMGVYVCTGGTSTMKCCLLLCSVLLLVLRIPHDANDTYVDTYDDQAPSSKTSNGYRTV